jgi:hypothetical protein
LLSTAVVFQASKAATKHKESSQGYFSARVLSEQRTPLRTPFSFLPTAPLGISLALLLRRQFTPSVLSIAFNSAGVAAFSPSHFAQHHALERQAPCILSPQIRPRRALEGQFTELLGRLRLDDEVLEWVRDALHATRCYSC